MSVTAPPSAADVYAERNPGSRALHERAAMVLPGGSTRHTTFFRPFPLYAQRGDGCRVWDVDGNPRIDFIGNYTALILGHRHPEILRALHAQVELGTAFAAANPSEIELAELLVERVPSVEKVRFTNSGTEATMFAMRLARAFTGRTRIARMEGGYHGTHDFAEVSTHPEDLSSAGPAEAPLPVPDSAGTPRSSVEATVVLPFNNLEASSRIIEANAADLAAVILEPVTGRGATVAEPEYLRGLREITRRHGIVLIFDEVIALRLGYHGAQGRLGVTPDLTTMGKIIGGGLPVAAFGGRADIMDLCDPGRPDSIPHGGTFNGNPLGMAAGLAAMRQLTPEVFERLDANGDWLRSRLEELFAAHDVPASVTGLGSLFSINFTGVQVRDYRTWHSADLSKSAELFYGLLNRGVLFTPRGLGALSTAIGQAELRHFVDAVDAVLEEHPGRFQI